MQVLRDILLKMLSVLVIVGVIYTAYIMPISQRLSLRFWMYEVIFLHIILYVCIVML